MFHVILVVTITGKGDDPIIIHMTHMTSMTEKITLGTRRGGDLNWYWHAIAIKSDSYP